MNWLTAVFGFLTLYCIGGLVYSLVRSADLDAILFFGGGILLFVVLGAANEFRTRRNATSNNAD